MSSILCACSHFDFILHRNLSKFKIHIVQMLCNYVLKNAQQVQQVCVCSLTPIGSLPVYIGLFIPNGMRKTIGFDNFPSIFFLSGGKKPKQRNEFTVYFECSVVVLLSCDDIYIRFGGVCVLFMVQTKNGRTKGELF